MLDRIGVFDAMDMFGTVLVRLMLRIDPELRYVSGDLFQFTGSVPMSPVEQVRAHWASFKIAMPPDTTSNAMSAPLMGAWSRAGMVDLYNRLEVTTDFGGRVQATFTHDSFPGVAEHVLAFRPSPRPIMVGQEHCFREIDLEVDLIVGTEPLLPYEFTDAAGPRTMTVQSAFARAGIRINNASQAGHPVLQDDNDQLWTPAELRGVLSGPNAALRGGDLESEERDWYLYLLIASHFRWEDGEADPGIAGYMFEDRRRGAAVFHGNIKQFFGGEERHVRRNLLRTACHEIGHAFNLLHGSGGDLSFMHEIGGPNWPDSQLQFSRSDLLWMRHEFLDSVIMGGADFRGGNVRDSLDEMDARQFRQFPNLFDGLELKLRLRPRRNRSKDGRRVAVLRFGEPVRVEVKIKNHLPQPRYLRGTLGLETHRVRVYVKRPRSEFVRFAPLAVADELSSVESKLDGKRELWRELDLTYGLQGFTFIEPGFYEIGATIDYRGASIRSNTLPVWVSYPRPGEERMIVPFLTQETGAYLAARGGPQSGDALDALAHGQGRSHPLAAVHREIQALTRWFGFKTVERGSVKRIVKPRSATPDQIELALGVRDGDVSTLKPPKTLGNISIGRLLWMLAQSEDSEEKRTAVGKTAMDYVARQGMSPPAQAEFRKQLDREDAPPLV